MDSSTILEGTGECSSTESGWTMYIASPDYENNLADDDDKGDDSIGHQQGRKKDAVEAAQDINSDDSMASDASSGPSDRGHLSGHVGRSRGFGHAGKKAERKYAGKKHNQQEEKKKHHEQMKTEKDKSVNRANSAGRSKKT